MRDQRDLPTSQTEDQRRTPLATPGPGHGAVRRDPRPHGPHRGRRPGESGTHVIGAGRRCLRSPDGRRAGHRGLRRSGPRPSRQGRSRPTRSRDPHSWDNRRPGRPRDGRRLAADHHGHPHDEALQGRPAISLADLALGDQVRISQRRETTADYGHHGHPRGRPDDGRPRVGHRCGLDDPPASRRRSTSCRRRRCPRARSASYSMQLEAYSSNGTPYAWSATNLPPGMSLSSIGQLSGTPTSGGLVLSAAHAHRPEHAGNYHHHVHAGHRSIRHHHERQSAGCRSRNGLQPELRRAGCVSCVWSLIGTLPNGLSLAGNTISGTPTTVAASGSRFRPRAATGPCRRCSTSTSRPPRRSRSSSPPRRRSRIAVSAR